MKVNRQAVDGVAQATPGALTEGCVGGWKADACGLRATRGATPPSIHDDSFIEISDLDSGGLSAGGCPLLLCPKAGNPPQDAYPLLNVLQRDCCVEFLK